MKTKKSKLIGRILWCVFWIVVGVALSVGSFLIPTIQVEPYLKWITLSLGVLMVVVSAVCIAVFASRIKKLRFEQLVSNQVVASANASKQTSKQLFAQLGLMDDAQFSVYVARRYQAKGYVVRFLPMLYGGVSFLAEKDKSVTAVICFVAKGLLTADQLSTAVEQRKSNSYKSATLVTNAQLDGGAKKLCRKEKIFVVDRGSFAKQLL